MFFYDKLKQALFMIDVIHMSCCPDDIVDQAESALSNPIHILLLTLSLFFVSLIHFSSFPSIFLWLSVRSYSYTDNLYIHFLIWLMMAWSMFTIYLITFMFSSCFFICLHLLFKIDYFF